MKLHKLISRTVLATALLGATIGGALSNGISANADQGKDANGQSTENTQGDATQSNLNNKTKSGSNGGNIQNYKTNTNVQDGFLTLDSVPIFNFGNSQNHQSNIAGQPTTLNLNSQNDGVLRITDYRNLDKKNYQNNPSQQSGWLLSVKMSGFENTSNYNGNSGNGLNQSDWTMHLNNTGNYHNLDYDTNNNGDASKAVFNNQNISTNNQNDGYMLDSTGQGATNSNGVGKGYGVNQITYHNNNDATLDIPNVPSGTYTANMTWTLSTPLNSYNTNSDNNS